MKASKRGESHQWRRNGVISEEKAVNGIKLENIWRKWRKQWRIRQSAALKETALISNEI